MRVSGIFTATTVSPSPTLRQRPSCYTIRAGRNLPDKEFRYLRLACYALSVVTASPRRFEILPYICSGMGTLYCAHTYPRRRGPVRGVASGYGQGQRVRLERGFRHFCGILPIAKEVGLYLGKVLLLSLRRVVSGDSPAQRRKSFLLVICTGRFVTRFFVGAIHELPLRS